MRVTKFGWGLSLIVVANSLLNYLIRLSSVSLSFLIATVCPLQNPLNTSDECPLPIDYMNLS